jgi:hypothetical protein
VQHSAEFFFVSKIVEQLSALCIVFVCNLARSSDAAHYGAGDASRYGSVSDQMMRLRLCKTDFGNAYLRLSPLQLVRKR